MTALTDFTATTIDGHERSLADHAGRGGARRQHGQ